MSTVLTRPAGRTATRPPPETPVPPRPDGPPGLPVRGSLSAVYRLSIIAAVLLAVTSVSGLLWGTRGLYQADPLLLPQLIGQDALGLAMTLPLLLGSMWLARRGSSAGLLLWSGALFYTAYWYYFYVAGVRFGPLFLVHAALVATSGAALVLLLARLDARALRPRFAAGFPAGLVGGFMTVTGVLFAGLWMMDVLRRLRMGEPLDAVSRAVYAADLVVALPALVAVGVALVRERPWGFALAGMLLVKAAAGMLTLLVTTGFVRWWGQPVEPFLVGAFGSTFVAALACTVAYLRALRE